MKFLEVILKTVETCNINCTYCYFFIDTDLADRQISKVNKKIISLSTIRDLIIFLKHGIKELSIDLVKIVFHGGEPLLQNRNEFDQMCSFLISNLASEVSLQLGIQTNGICINSHWLKLFEKYKISPGISIDGTEEYNDIQRIDFAGRGTYKRVVRGIQQVQAYVAEERIAGVSTISVIDARFSAKEIFYHFVNELKIKAMNFLLPDYNYDTYIEHLNETGSTIENYGKFMCELFDTWLENNDETIDIVFFRQIVTLLMGSKNALMVDTGPPPADEDFPVLTVYYDGTITPDDTYITTDKNINNKKLTLKNSTLEKFIASPEVKLIKYIRKQTPKACLSCKWLKICNGGASINRYSKKNGFDNPTIYCEALKMLYPKITDSLIANGIPQSLIDKQLNYL